MRISSAQDLGSYVRQRRGARGLTQDALARAAGVSVRWLQALEAGKSSSEVGLVLRTLDALASVLTIEDERVDLDLDAVLEALREPNG